jgi:hypothetical protein
MSVLSLAKKGRSFTGHCRSPCSNLWRVKSVSWPVSFFLHSSKPHRVQSVTGRTHTSLAFTSQTFQRKPVCLRYETHLTVWIASVRNKINTRVFCCGMLTRRLRVTTFHATVFVHYRQLICFEVSNLRLPGLQTDGWRSVEVLQTGTTQFG